MAPANPRLDPFFARPRPWHDEAATLRAIVIGSGLEEERKWGQPCYTFEGANVVIIGEFKDFCALNFFKGALLGDPEGVLEAPGANSRAARQFRFTGVDQIVGAEPVIRAYLAEAIKLEQSGARVDFDTGREMPIPEELEAKFAASSDFHAAFTALTPGRQREYLLHFGWAKQSSTRTSRIERQVERILSGKGMRDT